MDKRTIVIIGGVSAGAMMYLRQWLERNPDAIIIRPGLTADAEGNLREELILDSPASYIEPVFDPQDLQLAQASSDFHTVCELPCFSVENPGFFAIKCVLKRCKTSPASPVRGPPCG